jgi:glucose/arabinose dehydrogenase
MVRKSLILVMSATLLVACSDGSSALFTDANAASSRTVAGAFVATELASFNEPWAMTFLPDGRLLVSEKGGTLKVHAIGGKTGSVSGVPKVSYGGQGGFGDVILHPDFASNGFVYVSYAEAGEGSKRGAAVARAKLTLDANGGGALSGLAVIWRQNPKVDGGGHYGHRMVFSPDGHLFITSGERQKFDPAQDMRANLGKIIRLKDDGSVPWRRKCGRSVTAIRSASPSTHRVVSGSTRWDPGAATS